MRDDPAVTVMPGITPVCGATRCSRPAGVSEAVFFDDRLLSAVVGVTAGTRAHPGIELGASPRAGIMFARACRALALVRGRDHVIDQDLVDLAPLVLAHRLRLKDARCRRAPSYCLIACMAIASNNSRAVSVQTVGDEVVDRSGRSSASLRRSRTRTRSRAAKCDGTLRA